MTPQLNKKAIVTNRGELMLLMRINVNRRNDSHKLGIFTCENPVVGKPISMVHLVNPPQQDVSPRIINDTTGILNAREPGTVGMTIPTRKADQERKTGGIPSYQIAPNGEKRILRDCQARKVDIFKGVGAATAAGPTSHTAHTITSDVRRRVYSSSSAYYCNTPL